MLDGEEEARLAFLGATRTLGRPLTGRVAVVDVGGGSTEIAVGTIGRRGRVVRVVRVRQRFPRRRLPGRRPAVAGELEAVRTHAVARAGGDRSRAGRRRAIAVGGSAASLRRLVGAELDAAEPRRARCACSPAARPSDVAARFDLDAQRVRLMPAGLLALDAAAQALGRPLQIGCGGLREGVLIDLAGL